MARCVFCNEKLGFGNKLCPVCGERKFSLACSGAEYNPFDNKIGTCVVNASESKLKIAFDNPSDQIGVVGGAVGGIVGALIGSAISAGVNAANKEKLDKYAEVNCDTSSLKHVVYPASCPLNGKEKLKPERTILLTLENGRPVVLSFAKESKAQELYSLIRR